MLDAIRWDSDLIRRYDLAGPRYTSYPTAMQFTDQVSTFDLLHALRESRKASRPLSLYVHVPFCANICYYCACNKVITKDRGRAQAYLQRLEQEIQLVACHLDPNQRVQQLHFGGGTPTFLSHDELRQLMAQLRQHFNLLDDDSGDYGIEQIEMLAQVRHQLAQFVVAEKGRRAAAKVQLLDLLRRIQVAGDQLDFLFEPLQIRQGAAAILGDDLVAGAVVTNVGAERHMHIQRQWPYGLAAVAQGVQQVEGADLAGELYGGGVGGVARPREVVAMNQISVPTNGVEHAGVPRIG